MQFRDLKKQYDVLKLDIDKGIQDVLDTSNYISGSQVKELEQQLAEYVGVKHCITCANGTDALTLALMAWNIGEGDAIFVPDFTFFASGEVVSYAGATPIFVDVCEDTFNMSVECLEEAIVKVIDKGDLVPRVIIAVDLFGQPADYPNIREIADKYNLLILEDGAQGFGGAIGNKRACSFGDISTTSFFPAKPLGCYGDGGAIFTDNDEWAELIKSYCVHGKGQDKYDNIRIGVNSRLDTIQAAVLKVKFKAFVDYEIESVNKVAKLYSEQLNKYVRTPIVKDGFFSSWAQYSIILPDEIDRMKLQEYLRKKNIPTMIYYVKPMHLQGAFADLKSYGIKYDVSMKVSDRILALPMHPYLECDDINYIVKCIQDYIVKNFS